MNSAKNKPGGQLQCTPCSWAAGMPVHFPRIEFVVEQRYHIDCPSRAAYRAWRRRARADAEAAKALGREGPHFDDCPLLRAFLFGLLGEKKARAGQAGQEGWETSTK